MKRLVGSIISAAWICLMVSSHICAETTAYIPNAGDDNAKEVVVSSEAFSPVDVCQGPYGAAVTPDGDHLIITCPDDDSITVMPTGDFTNPDGQDNTALEVGDEPRGVAIESNGTYAYVANYGTDTVDEIAMSSANVVNSYDVGDGPWGVAATYDSVNSTIKVYVANHLAGTVSVISDSGVDTITGVGDGPLGVALTPDGRYLYVANLNADQVVVIDTSDHSIDATISVGDGPWGVAMADDGAYVFVTNSLAGTVSVIATATRTVAGPYAVGDQPMGVAAPVNGDFAYVVNQGETFISKITTAGAVTTVGSGELNSAVGLGAFIGDNPPSAPSSLDATVDGPDIALTWNDNATDELGFKIERRKDGEDAFAQIAKVDENVTEYTDRNLDGGAIYNYRVRAYKEASDSGYSSTTNATAGDESFSWCFINSLFD